jgi:hypothetical protein
MATRKKGAKKTVAKKKGKGFTPANRFIRYQVTTSATPGTETSHYIDLARDLSLINRRLYRQGKVYQVANISITSRNTVNGLASFSTAPDTWVTRAAWNRGFKLYQHMQNKVLELPGSASRKGRYNDFKVYLSDDHRTSSNVPRPKDNGNSNVKLGEWTYSKFVSPDGSTGADEFVAHLLGDHSGSAGSRASVGLVYSYGEARATVNSSVPNVDSDGDDDPLVNLFDAGTQVDEIADDLLNDADAPPYYLTDGTDDSIGDGYPGSRNNMPKPIVNRLVGIGMQGGTSAPTVMLPGFTALAGLIELEVQSDAISDTFDVLIEIAPGSYKGVAGFDI